MRAATAIAAARATGAVALDSEQLNVLQATCVRVGRCAVPVHERSIAVVYSEGYGANLEDSAIGVYELPQTRLVALGLCLTLCHDPQHGQTFGRKATLADFDAALARLRLDRGRTASTETSIRNAHVKGALFELHEMGYIRLEADTIELGPALAGWSNGDWALVGELHDQPTEATT